MIPWHEMGKSMDINNTGICGLFLWSWTVASNIHNLES